MIYYTVLLIYILLVYLLKNSFYKGKKANKFVFIMVSLGLVLFQGLRSFHVGTDLNDFNGYIDTFTNIGKMKTLSLDYLNYEPGFIIFNKILYSLGFSARGFLFIVSILIQIPIVYTICKYSSNILISLLWYLSLGGFFFTFSGLRQSIAMSLCFAAYPLIKNKKLFYFILVVLLASTFHKSALFCLILYPLYHFNLDKKKFYISLAIIGFVFVFRYQLYSLFSSLYYGNTGSTTSTNAYTMLLAYTILYLCSFLNKRPSEIYKGLRNILFVVVLIFLFASVHDYITRVGYPLVLYLSLFIPEFVKIFKVTPKYVYYSLINLFLIFCYYMTMGTLDTLPFSFL